MTEGLLRNPVAVNNTYVLAQRTKELNLQTYRQNTNVTRRNIEILEAILVRALRARTETERTPAQYGTLRPEPNKILIVLSDGKPNDQNVNRPGAGNMPLYAEDYAVKDTALEVRRARSLGISVLGVFMGEDQDLLAERKIFGKDFAYIKNIANFSNVVGTYLRKQLEEE